MKTERTKNMERLWDALALMRTVHGTQKDKCGQPYWIHPFTVAMGCFNRYRGEELSSSIVGALHDVIEDTDYTIQDINQKVPLTDEENEALQLLTRGSGVSYKQYIDRIVNSNNQIAIRVKMEDILHNSVAYRFDEANIVISDKDRQRFRKYAETADKLLEKLQQE